MRISDWSSDVCSSDLRVSTLSGVPAPPQKIFCVVICVTRGPRRGPYIRDCDPEQFPDRNLSHYPGRVELGTAGNLLLSPRIVTLSANRCSDAAGRTPKRFRTAIGPAHQREQNQWISSVSSLRLSLAASSAGWPASSCAPTRNRGSS